MKCKLTIFCIFLSSSFIFISASNVNAGDEVISLEKIVVTLGKIPQEISEVTRSIQVIDEEDIEVASVNSIAELLDNIQSVDVKRRGAYGVQSDISIRGSTYEQVLILVNGIKINDPQTGHYNMDLPISLDEIERIEVIKGAVSSVYGANALAGVINIITKKPEGKRINLEVSIGEHSLSKQLLAFNYSLKGINNRILFERKESSGYRPDTDFEITTFSLNSILDYKRGYVEFFGGFTKKDFGASNFYSNLYPHEEDHTKTTFLTLKAKAENEVFSLDPSIYYRRHWDKFILDRNRPWWYVNFHTTYSYGVDIPVNINMDWANLAIGSEIRQEKITSTNLGNHERSQGALYMQLKPKINERVILDLGLREDHYQKWDWKLSPSASFGYYLNPSLKLRASVAKAFRIPTFTDLYYVSPANVGNEDLTPEKAISYEIGFDYEKDNFSTNLTFFRREAKDVIDWGRNNSNEVWRAQNLSNVNTNGLELRSNLDLNYSKAAFTLSDISFGYTYLNSTQEAKTNLSKYVANYLRHQFLIETLLGLPFDLKQTITLNYEERINQRHYFLLDTKISKKISKEKFNIEFYILGTNLLNTSYSDISDVAMAGRWFEAGIKYDF